MLFGTVYFSALCRSGGGSPFVIGALAVPTLEEFCNQQTALGRILLGISCHGGVPRVVVKITRTLRSDFIAMEADRATHLASCLKELVFVAERDGLEANYDWQHLLRAADWERHEPSPFPREAKITFR